MITIFIFAHIYIQIDELKTQNSQLSLNINEYKESLDAEKRQISVANLKLSSVDSATLYHEDLSNQLDEANKLIKSLKTENDQLKTENSKYKIALENNNESKQKREEIYKNEKLKSEQRITELQQTNKQLEEEMDSLRQEMTVLVLQNKTPQINSNTFSSYYKPQPLIDISTTKAPTTYHVAALSGIKEASPNAPATVPLLDKFGTESNQKPRERQGSISMDMGGLIIMSDTLRSDFDGKYGDVGLEMDDGDGHDGHVTEEDTKTDTYMQSHGMIDYGSAQEPGLSAEEMEGFKSLVETQKEMGVMREQLVEATTQLREFKRRIVAQDGIIKQLKKEKEMNKTGRGKKSRGKGDDGDFSCVIYGFEAW